MTPSNDDRTGVDHKNEAGRQPAGDLSPKEAASLLGCSATTIKRLLRSHALTGYRCGGKIWRIQRTALDDYRMSGGGLRP